MHGRHIVLLPFPGLCPELVCRGYHVSVATIVPVAERVIAAGAEPLMVDTDTLT